MILGAKAFNPPTSEIPFLLFALYNPQNMAGRKRPRTADHGDDSQGASNAGTSHSSRRTLNHRELAREASKIVNNADSAELVILELMDKYSFSLPRLKELLTGKSITPFSITLSHY